MKKSVTALFLIWAVFCSACQSQVEPVSEYQLYFVAAPEHNHGAAVMAQPWKGEGVPTAQQLFQSLLDGPTEEGMVSPFPAGVSMVRCEQVMEPMGHLKVVLSEQYSALTDISLTLADYCIVMTLTQLPQVDSVEIQTQGSAGGYRSHSVLRRDEVELPVLLP